jgi:opacity protein-like surface antigen
MIAPKQQAVTRMRRCNGLGVLVMVVLGGPAFAGDFGNAFLRGSIYEPGEATYYRWGGVYVGGQGGFSVGSFDFGNATSSLLSYILRNSVLEDHVSDWTTLPKADATGASFGGFMGYNFQWENVVIGAELNYNRTSLQHSAADSVGPLSFVDNTNAPANYEYLYSVTVNASSSIRVTDFGSLRGRFGWAAGCFLPYTFIGVAVGRADVTRFASVSGTRTDVITTTITDPLTGAVTSTTSLAGPFPLSIANPSATETQNGVFAYGYAAGLGLDVALLSNLFVRAEWEWMQFTPVKDIRVHVNTIRAGAGLKF